MVWKSVALNASLVINFLCVVVNKQIFFFSSKYSYFFKIIFNINLLKLYEKQKQILI